jgi:hypothetical protein
MAPQGTQRTLSRSRVTVANNLIVLALLGSISRREKFWIRRYYYLVLAKETFNHRKKSIVKGSVMTLHMHKKQPYHRRKIS